MEGHHVGADGLIGVFFDYLGLLVEKFLVSVALVALPKVFLNGGHTAVTYRGVDLVEGGELHAPGVMLPSPVEVFNSAVATAQEVVVVADAIGTVAAHVVGHNADLVVKLPADDIFVVGEFLCHFLNDVTAEFSVGFIGGAGHSSVPVNGFQVISHDEYFGVFVRHPGG